MQRIDYILNEIKDRGLNVSKIATELGIPVQRFHKWVKGKNQPKTEDAGKLLKWALENLEEYLNNTVNDPPAIYIKEATREDKLLNIISSQQESILNLTRQISIMQSKITSMEEYK